jgi:hypothetical protein
MKSHSMMKIHSDFSIMASEELATLKQKKFSEIEAIELTEQEISDAILEAKRKKYHQNKPNGFQGKKSGLY